MDLQGNKYRIIHLYKNLQKEGIGEGEINIHTVVKTIYMPDTEFYNEFRKLHPKPHFLFPEIASTSEYIFEKLSPKNFQQLYLLFKSDLSLFVDERFKTYHEAREYAQYISVCGAYMPKHGCQDWLLKLKDGNFTSVIHLYDLSLETFGQNHKRAWIGFATKERYRNQDITSKAITHFINYIFECYPVIDFIHAMTNKENKAAIGFLLKCGFLPDHEERLSKDHAFFILSRSVLS